jgi:periplasmic protein TonB
MFKKWLRFLPAILIVLLIGLAIIGGVYLKDIFHKDDAPQKKMVQQITMMNPPPPPPPPPPKEEIEEPEVEEEPIEEETEAPPDEAAEQAPAQEASEGAATGNDGFGLAKNTGRGWGLGAGGGYEQHVRQEINEFILEHERLKHMDYIAMLTLRIGEGGEFESFEVEIVSGAPEAGDIIRKILRDKRKLAKPRPLEAASVVKLRIKSIL